MLNVKQRKCEPMNTKFLVFWSDKRRESNLGLSNTIADALTLVFQNEKILHEGRLPLSDDNVHSVLPLISMHSFILVLFSIVKLKMHVYSTLSPSNQVSLATLKFPCASISGGWQTEKKICGYVKCLLYWPIRWSFNYFPRCNCLCALIRKFWIVIRSTKRLPTS